MGSKTLPRQPSLQFVDGDTAAPGHAQRSQGDPGQSRPEFPALPACLPGNWKESGHHTERLV